MRSLTSVPTCFLYSHALHTYLSHIHVPNETRSWQKKKIPNGTFCQDLSAPHHFHLHSPHIQYSLSSHFTLNQLCIALKDLSNMKVCRYLSVITWNPFSLCVCRWLITCLCPSNKSLVFDLGIMLRLAGKRTYGDSPWTTWSGIWCIVTFQALSVAHLKIQYRKYFRKISSANYYLVTYILFPYLVFPVQEGIITTYHTWGRK